jgi:hypothetical protein
MPRRASEAEQLRDALSHSPGGTDDSDGAEKERDHRSKRRKKAEAAEAEEEEEAVATKRRKQDKGSKQDDKPSKKGKKNGSGSRNEELLKDLKELSNFDESSVQEFIKWREEKKRLQERGSPQFGVKPSSSSSSSPRPPPSAPRGPGRHNLPPKTKKRKAPDGQPGRTISINTMLRHANIDSRTRTLARHARSRRASMLLRAHGTYQFALTAGQTAFLDCIGDGLDQRKLMHVWKFPTGSSGGKRAGKKLTTEEGSTVRVNLFRQGLSVIR